MNKLQRFIKQQPVWAVCAAAIIIVSFYWGLLASDKYVSQSNVVLESPQMASVSFDFSSMLSGVGAGNSDMLLLRDYLLSIDMFNIVDEQVGFSQQYTNRDYDYFSRMGSDLSLEQRHEYYLKQVSVELDDYAGVLRINIRAFTPELAQQINQLLLVQGEAKMNALGRKLAIEQVHFLQQQVITLSDKFDAARDALLAYQNKNGLFSPTATVENIATIVASLEAQLSSLQAEKIALMNYQNNDSPQMVALNNKIAAYQEQIDTERKLMAQQSGDALNVKSAAYQTLELKVQFAQESYSAGLIALENTRIEAARKLKQLSVLQQPTLPEYSLEPQRLYNVTVFALVALFITLIVQMLILVIKDHRD